VPQVTTAPTRTISLRYLHQLDHILLGNSRHIAIKDFGSLSLPSSTAGSVLWDTIVVMLAPLKQINVKEELFQLVLNLLLVFLGLLDHFQFKMVKQMCMYALNHSIAHLYLANLLVVLRVNMDIMQLVQMIANIYATLIHFVIPGNIIQAQDFTEVSGPIDIIHALLDITVRILIKKHLYSAQRVLFLSEGQAFAQIVVLDITKIKQGHYIVSFAQLGIIVLNRDKQVLLSAVSISILSAEQLLHAKIVIPMNMHLKAQDGVTFAHQDASVNQRASPFVIHHQL